MPASTYPLELMRVSFTQDEDGDWYHYVIPENGTDPEDGYFSFDVPAVLVAKADDAWRAVRAAEAALIEAVPLDPIEPRLAVCCPTWTGSTNEGYTTWSVVLTSTGDGTEWPVRDHKLSFHRTEAGALAEVDRLPSRFLVHHLGQAPLVEVTKDRLRIERSSVPSSYGRCRSCGWQRKDHAGVDRVAS